MASMLNFSWAEMGMMGELSATVPRMNFLDGFVVGGSGFFAHQVDFVLEDDDVLAVG